jgi:cytochrome c
MATLIGVSWSLTGVLSSTVFASDVDDYPEAFERCLSCHAYHEDEPLLTGPSLWQVFGRPIATYPEFDYSPALKSIQGRWDRETLDRFLTNPNAFAPGTKMELGGIRNAAERAEVIAFLETLRE